MDPIDDWGAPVLTSEKKDDDDWADPKQKDVPKPPAHGPRENPLDTQEHAAGTGTIARASLAPDEQVQLKRYAEAFKQPIGDFHIIDGHVIRKIPGTETYARVQTSVRGAEGPIDAAKRAMDWVASGAGPAIPAVASMAAMVPAALAAPGTAGASLLAASAAGAAGASAGEVARQKLDKWLDGEDVPMDYENVGWQGAAGLAGPLVGKAVELAAPAVGRAVTQLGKAGVAADMASAGIGSAAEQAAVRGAETAAKPSSFGLSPRVEAALRSHVSGKEAELAELRKDAQDLGVDLSLAQLTGSAAVRQSERQLIRQPETVQAVEDLRIAQNNEQIPGAVRKVMDEIAPDAPGEQQVAGFRDAAVTVIDKTFKEQSKLAKPAYEAALDGKQPFWSDELKGILKRPSFQAGWKEAEKDAAEESRVLPRLFNKADDGTFTLNEQLNSGVDFRDWQHLKIAIRKAIESETDDVTSKMTPDGRRMQSTLKDMMKVLYKANPEWKAADAAYGSASEVTEAVLEGGVGFLNKMSGPDRQNIVNRIFSGDNLIPEEIGAMRRQFNYAGKSAEWNAGVRSYIGDILADAVAPLKGGGEPANVGGGVYKNLFEKRQSAILQAAMGGAENPNFINRWNQLGRVMKAASRQLPEGAATATDAGTPGITTRGVQALKYVLHPSGMATDLLDGLSKMQDPAQAKKLAETLLTPEGDKLLKALQPTTPGTSKANSILTRMFIQAGVVEGVEEVRSGNGPKGWSVEKVK